MTTPLLSAEQLEALRRYNTPTISNAIEIFNIRKRHLGFLPHTIRCLFPDMAPIVGYAVTSQTRAEFSPETGARHHSATISATWPRSRVRRSPWARTWTTRPAWAPSSAR